jgi:hypothetical protein
MKARITLTRDIAGRTAPSPLLARRGGHDIKRNIAKLPLMERTGWWFRHETALDQPPRRFAPPLLSRRGDRLPDTTDLPRTPQ